MPCWTGAADIAVHSAKDLTAATVDGLTLAAVPERGDPRDALAGRRLAELPAGAVIGTGSVRRQVQIRARRDDVEVVGLRGNIATRLGRLGELDAIVVAAAALERLGLSDRIAEIFEVDDFVPQVAQGALAIECRSDDPETFARLQHIEDTSSRLCVDAERAFLARLGGDCDLPAGAHATLDGSGRLRLVGVLASEGTGPAFRSELHAAATPEASRAAGVELAESLLGRVDAGG